MIQLELRNLTSGTQASIGCQQDDLHLLLMQHGSTAPHQDEPRAGWEDTRLSLRLELAPMANNSSKHRTMLNQCKQAWRGTRREIHQAWPNSISAYMGAHDVSPCAPKQSKMRGSALHQSPWTMNLQPGTSKAAGGHASKVQESGWEEMDPSSLFIEYCPSVIGPRGRMKEHHTPRKETYPSYYINTENIIELWPEKELSQNWMRRLLFWLCVKTHIEEVLLHEFNTLMP